MYSYFKFSFSSLCSDTLPGKLEDSGVYCELEMDQNVSHVRDVLKCSHSVFKLLYSAE